MSADPAVHGNARPAPATGKRRTRNAARARAELLQVATEEFARVGYYGARVDEIAAKSSTTKRMIYYYFDDKDGLFTAVLERAYAAIRAAEKALDLSALPPLAAVAALIEHTLRYHATHPELARLVAAENALGAAHLRASPADRDEPADPGAARRHPEPGPGGRLDRPRHLPGRAAPADERGLAVPGDQRGHDRGDLRRPAGRTGLAGTDDRHPDLDDLHLVEHAGPGAGTRGDG